MFKKLLPAYGVLLGLSSVAFATPFIGLDDPTGPATPITLGATFFSNGSGGGAFDYLNNTGSVLTEVQFQVEVSSFSPGAYSCQSGFFLDCTFSAVANSGGDLLSIDFSGVNPPDIETGCDTESTEKEGIPIPVAGCSGVGDFYVTLDNPANNNPTDPNGAGGWGSNTQFTVTSLNNVALPEPSSLTFFGVSLLLLGCLGLRRKCRQRV